MPRLFDKLISYKDRCKGCGVCTVACPTKSITMGLNLYGEYQPYVDLDSCANCGRCKTVCPMDNNKTEYEKDLLGDFSRFYVVHSSNKKIRNSCSSGGAITQILIHLLNRKEIDRVVCVSFKYGGKPYFAPRICNTVDEIFDCRGSKYYPVEFSEVLTNIKNTEYEYALVCLPCVAIAIRRLQRIDKCFERIKYLICITCGHNKTTHYIDFISRFYKLEPPYKYISFRNKGYFPFSNYSLKVVDNFGKSLDQNFMNGFINKLWGGFYFAQKACLSCRDIFGLDGDISCMDAWLYPYNRSRNGYNFLIAKLGASKELIEDNPNIIVKEINKQNVIDSQKVNFDRKSKGYIPEKFLINIELSERFIVENKEYSFLLNNLLQIKNGKDSATVRYRYNYNYILRKIKENIKQRINYYENLIGR